MSNPIHSMRPPIPNGMAFPTKVKPRDFDPQESIMWLEQFAAALHDTPRLAVDVETTKSPDGVLTIRVTPQKP